MKARWRKVSDRFAWAFIIASALSMMWAFGVEPNRLVIRQVDVPLPGWPADNQPLRIALISDLHVGAPFMSLEKIDEIVARINNANPDVVLLLGDYMAHVVGGDTVPPEQFANALGNLNASVGVYGVLGIHDWWFDGPRVGKALQAAGIEMVDNDAIKIERPGGSFWVAGIGDFNRGNPAIPGTLSKLTDDAPVILATHNPDIFPGVTSRVAITVAGHTHGGQVYLPLIGRPAIPSQYGDRYSHGLIVEAGKHLFVTSGLGTSVLPMRFLIPPEIVILNVSSPHTQVQ